MNFDQLQIALSLSYVINKHFQLYVNIIIEDFYRLPSVIEITNRPKIYND